MVHVKPICDRGGWKSCARLVVLATLAGVGGLAAVRDAAAVTVVSVNAATSGTADWTFATTSGNSSLNGSFVGAAGSTAMGTSWGLYANSGQTSSQTYSFASALQAALGTSVLPVGGSVQIQVSLGYNNGGTVGVSLQNSSGINRFETYYIGNDASDTFKLNDAGGQENIAGPNTSFNASSWMAAPAEYQTILFTQLASNQYALSFDGVAVTNAGLVLAASDISQIRFFNYNAGSGSGNNQYANNLIVVPEPGSITLVLGGFAALATAWRSRALVASRR